MPRSRVCPSCGLDTSGSPPFLERSLGLMVHQCGRCSHATVTRRHAGVVERARLARRWLHAGTWLAAQGFFATGVFTLVPLACLGLQYSMAAGGCGPWAILAGMRDSPEEIRRRLADWYDAGQSGLFFAWIMSSAAAGVWIGAMLGHAGRLRALIVVATLCAVIAAYFAWIRSYLSPHPSREPWWTTAIGGATFAALSIPAMALAMPIGTAAGRAGFEVRRMALAAMLRRERARRRR
ncbi:MAG: hypothetical protein KF787_00275 [Phycisphaeraceae bacterium]|nr:hypothetical protein [Phycisphaerae bacterium]MBX3391059.1 hypothetical protein [Phycisphaeraceae bacterium]